MKITKAPGLMKYPYTIEATEEEYQAIRNAIPSENNQGYEIIKAETYSTRPDGQELRIVLGKMETRLGTQYVTWESLKDACGNADYFWGNYHDNEHAALCEYHTRLAGKFE